MHPLILEQPHLVKGLETLSKEAQVLFLEELNQLSLSLLLNQRKGFLKTSCDLAPFEAKEEKAPPKMEKMGCLILAGGQASRLKTNLPKALAKVSPSGKTLLQLFCEKTAAAERLYGSSLPLAVMTSPLNHRAIKEYLEHNQYFGLEHVDLFSQEMVPFLDDQGNWMLEAPGKIARGPDGNGGCLRQFMKAGLWDKWHTAGIEYLNVLPIDNPLANPFDAEFLGFHLKHGGDVSLKAVIRSPKAEAVGVIGLKNGKIAVQEYTDLPKNAEAFPLAHIGLYCFDFDFIARVAEIELPWHLARKKANGVEVWKCERFIFDLLDHARSAHVMVCPRAKTYAPLKNYQGEKSFETVREALQSLDREVYEKISGLTAPQEPFELDPAFHYPPRSLLETWKGKPLPLITSNMAS